VDQGFLLKIILLRAIFLNEREVCEEACKVGPSALKEIIYTKSITP